MRHVNLRVSEGDVDAVESVLKDHDLDYITIQGDGDDNTRGTLFEFPLPSQAVTDVFDDLSEAGVSDDAYTVFTDATHVDTPQYDEIQEQYATTVRGLSRRELHSKVQSLSWPPITYYAGTILSAIVATAGLLLDSPAIVIGAMVIAPQVSSALSMTAGVYHSDWEMFVDSARRQSVGLAGAIAGAAAFAWLVQWMGFVPAVVDIGSLELMGLRLAPTFLSSVAALGAGAVGAFGYTTNQSMSLVGVMIAAAIIPAAAASGIAVAWGSWLLALGAFLLLAVNVLAINVGAMATMLVMGYQPVWFDRAGLGATLPSGSRATVSVVALLFLFSVVATGALAGLHLGYERAMNDAVDDTFSEPQYEDLTVMTVQSQYGGWAGTSPNVSVEVSRTSNENYSSLPTTLERRIERRTGRDVSVTVSYTESRSTNASDVRVRNESPARRSASVSRRPRPPRRAPG